MLKQAMRPLLFLSLFAFLILAACQTIDSGEDASGQLMFSGPAQVSVPVGEFMPGTGIQYLRPDEERGAEVNIDGQTVYKRTADSVNWKGSSVAGTELKTSQRVLHYDEQKLSLAGTITIRVEGANPQALPSAPDGPIKYRFPVTYNLTVGEPVPGTQLVLNSIDPDLGAEFVGWVAPDFNKMGDSVDWDGTLRPGVAVSYRLRVAFIRDDTAQLAGFVDVYLGGNQ